MNTKDIGNAWAYAFSEAHESEVPIELALEKQMDRFNNGVGILKGGQYSMHSDDNIALYIQSALLAGELRYLSPLDFTVSPRFADGGLNGILPTTILIPTNQ